MSGEAPYVSVVAPVYNEAGNLARFHARVTAALEPLARPFEIILVDDGSRDDSWALIVDLQRRDARVRGLRFTRNFGQHPALFAGLSRAAGEWVVLMDCDLQDRPEEIPRLLRVAEAGAVQIVMAQRTQRRDRFFKRLLSRLFYLCLNHLAEIRLDGQTANFGVYHQRVVAAFRGFREHHPFIPAMRSWTAFPTAYLEIEHGERSAGQTAYSLGRMWRLASGVILAHSDKPLRVSIQVGFTLALAAAGVMAWLILRKLWWAVPVEGWTSVMVSLFFIGGLLLANMGVLGLYIGRIFDEVKSRPIYLTRDEVGPR